MFLHEEAQSGPGSALGRDRSGSGLPATWRRAQMSPLPERPGTVGAAGPVEGADLGHVRIEQFEIEDLFPQVTRLKRFPAVLDNSIFRAPLGFCLR
jgi:hypothetical protein